MTRKNILLMSIDDGGAFWRFRDVFGARLQTPNLDRICAASTTFTSAYCQAPICGPSRNSMLSGFAPHQTGILDNYTNLFEAMRPEQLWQFRLKQAGYYCSTAGKIHHSFAPLQAQMHNILYSHPPTRLTFGPKLKAAVRRYGGLSGGAGTTDPNDDALYYDHQSSEDAVSFLESYDKAAPFYREVGFHHPHLPFKTPERFKDMYDEEDFQQPAEWANGFDVTSYPDDYMIQNVDTRNDDHWRKSVRNYFSAYSHVDTHIGKVWDALQASPHKDNTIFVLFSDHGFHLGDKNRFRKFTLWEESCRVPLIIHDPSATPQEIPDPVALLDIGPTLLDYSECAPLNGAPGRSLKPVVQEAPETPSAQSARDPDRGVPTVLFGNMSMRQGPWRIILYQNGDSEFHDVDKDPWLTKNLAHIHPEYAPMRAALLKVCAAHGIDTNKAGTDIDPRASDFVLRGAGDSSPLPTGLRGAIDMSATEDSDLSGTYVPGHHVLFRTLPASGTARLPLGYSKMHYGADTGGQIKTFTAYGNALDNEFLFPGSFNRFTLTFHPGPGRNSVIAQNDDLIVYAGRGETSVIAGNSDCVIYGGTGPTQMRAGKGVALFIGGAGDCEMTAGAGPTTMLSGGGRNQITTGVGPTHLTLDGGINRVVIKSTDMHLFAKRSGLPQAIHGFREGVIDLSDWADLGDVWLEQDRKDCILTCATEALRFVKTEAEVVKKAITGARLSSEGLAALSTAI